MPQELARQGRRDGFDYFFYKPISISGIIGPYREFPRRLNQIFAGV